jgi:hypothetical protein
VFCFPTHARPACDHDHLNKFNQKDITTWKKDMAKLTAIQFGGVSKT